MKKLFAFLFNAFIAATILSTSVAQAESMTFTFDISVTSCSSSTISGACGSFTPYNFTETWTLNDYSAPAPILYDFGGGSSMLKTTVVASAIVSPTPNSAVLAAAGMSASDISQSVYFENAVYYTNGVSSGNNIGNLRFRNQETLKPYNGDGTYEYKNYYQSLYFDISGTNFTNVQAMTPGVLAAYLTVGSTAGWTESGKWEHLGNCCTDEGRFTRSDLSFSGTATTLQVSVVPEPISSALFIVGGATLGFRRFRKSKVQ